MSPARSFLAAGGLTALVILAVLVVGVKQGAFGLGPDPAAVALQSEVPAPAQATLAPTQAGDRIQASRHDDDDDEDHNRDERPSRDGTGGSRAGSRAASRAHDDD